MQKQIQWTFHEIMSTSYPPGVKIQRVRALITLCEKILDNTRSNRQYDKISRDKNIMVCTCEELKKIVPEGEIIYF